jgi:uncharacterized protein (TIGR02594 family)
VSDSDNVQKHSIECMRLAQIRPHNGERLIRYRRLIWPAKKLESQMLRRSIAAREAILLAVTFAVISLGSARAAVVDPVLTADPLLIARARADIGKTARDLGMHRLTLWCSEYLRRLTGASDVDDRARSWETRSKVAPGVGVVAVLSRGQGGHVGIVSGFDDGGNPKIISGNHYGRVGESVYPRSRVIAWVIP